MTNIKYKEGSYLLHSVAFESQFIVSKVPVILQAIYSVEAKIATMLLPFIDFFSSAFLYV